MDISALLSPQEPSNGPNTSSPALSPRASPQRQRPAKPTKRSSSGLSVLAAHNASLQAQAQAQAHAQALAQASQHSSPTPSPGTPAATRQHPLSRQGSTSGMDTLAGEWDARLDALGHAVHEGSCGEDRRRREVSRLLERNDLHILLSAWPSRVARPHQSNWPHKRMSRQLTVRPSCRPCLHATPPHSTCDFCRLQRPQPFSLTLLAAHVQRPHHV